MICNGNNENIGKLIMMKAEENGRSDRTRTCDLYHPNEIVIPEKYHIMGILYIGVRCYSGYFRLCDVQFDEHSLLHI